MKRKIKCLVVACHAVSAYALQDLAREFGLPMLRVIEPLVQRALQNKCIAGLDFGDESNDRILHLSKAHLRKKTFLTISSIAAALLHKCHLSSS